MKKSAVLLVILMIFAALVTGCQKDSNAGAQTKTKRTDVIVYVEGVWKTLDPHNTNAYVDQYLHNQLFEALVTIDDDGKIKPALAKSWSVSSDGLTYTFALEKGVKFHTGEELKASDVVFSYNRAMKNPFMATFTNMIDNIKVVDDYTAAIKLKTVYAAFLANTAEVMILNEKFVAEKGVRISEQASGTGPYKMVSFDMNTMAKMTRFDGYRLGAAPIKDVTFKVITEATTATVAFEAGEIDFLMCLNPSSFAPLEKSGKYNTKLSPTLHTAYILLNNAKAPFDNVLVRQALNYAADKKTMIAVAYEGLAVPADLLATKNSFGVDLSGATVYTYNLKKAKELLAQAGYPNGLDLGTMTLLGGYHEKIAQVFQQSLAQIGCKLELRKSETTVSDANTGNYTMASMGSSYTNDFSYDSRFYTTSSINSGNMARYSNKRVDELFKLGDSTLDANKRQAYYKEAISLITKEAPLIPVFHKQIPYVWKKDLKAVPHLSSQRPWFIYEWSWN